MPHQCTNCGRTFADGSREMLSGCPNCGGNKFQFRPAGSADEGTAPPVADPVGGTDSTGNAERAGGAEQPRGPGRPDADERVDTAHQTDDAPPTDDAEPVGDGEEDGAQAAARSEMVSSDELPDAPKSAPNSNDGRGAGTAADPAADADHEESDPDIAALRQKLNDQFESIRILNPGQYELNLMELYDREEYIISLREDGRYVIEMPETWGVDDE